MHDTTPVSGQGTTAIGIEADDLPRHIAVIMDGNGRWASDRGMPRLEGHAAGVDAAEMAITECGNIGISTLTLYSFSIENWKRPAEEVEGLMTLYVHYLHGKKQDLIDNNVRFFQIGRRDGLPGPVLEAVAEVEDATSSCTGMNLLAAVNYGSRAEITDAMREIAAGIASGDIDAVDIDEEMISRHLYTRSFPDPDLVIRTGGEYRLSNYLLWQISYAEIHLSAALWPDFSREDLHAAIHDYASRDRRHGGVGPS